MPSTSNYRQQHRELLEVVGEIQKILDHDKLTNGAADQARSLLATLSGKLSVRLAMEDRNLYPAMQGAADTTVSSAAAKFSSEMGSLAGAFKEYTRPWPTGNAIAKDAGAFVDETKQVFTALGKRVEQEESVLYPLAETV